MFVSFTWMPTLVFANGFLDTGPCHRGVGCDCQLILDTGFSILDDILTGLKLQIIEHPVSSIEHQVLPATSDQRPQCSLQ
jgi:hypothetical protein